MKVVIIAGKAESGKTTLAHILKDKLEAQGKRVVVANYGGLVKYVATTFFGWDGEKDEKGRHLLQHIGTDIVRKKKSTYWIDFIVSIVNLFKNEWDYFIIDDGRFQDEIEVFDNLDTIQSYVIRINRLNHRSRLTEEQLKHPSEIALDNYSFKYNVSASNKDELVSYADKFIKHVESGENIV